MASIKRIASDLNWDLDKRTAYGNYNGYDITLVQNMSLSNSHDNFKILYVPINDLPSGSMESLNGYLTANKKPLRFFAFDLKNGLIVARFNETLKGINAARLKEILDLLIEGLRISNAQPRNTCAYCGNDETDCVTYINGVKLPAHQGCKDEAIRNNQQLQEQMKSQSSPAMSYVGAVVGAVLGVIPFAAAVWFGWYLGLLTFLAAFASYEGFKYMGGTAKKSTKFIIGVISLIAVLLSNVGLMGVIAVQNNVTIADVLAVPEINAVFIEMLGMSALFGLLGIAAVFARIRKDEFNTVIK